MKKAKIGTWTTIISYKKLTNSPPAIIIREIDFGGANVNVNLCFCGSGKKHKDCHHQIVENSAMAHLFEAFKIIDEDIQNGTHPECQANCNSCCGDYFDVSPVEYFNILNYIQESRTGIFLRRVYRKAFHSLPTFRPLRDDRENPQDISSCIFVDNRSGKCRIYEARPLLCRLYGYYEQFTDCGKAKDLLQFHDDEHTSNLLGNILTENGLIQLPAMPLVYWFGDSFVQKNDTGKAFSELFMISQEKDLNTYVRFIIDNHNLFDTMFKM